MESPNKNQAILEASHKKWSELTCRSCNKLHSFYYFSCKCCQSNFCPECYNRVISTNRFCITCRADIINIIEIQKSEQEYLSTLIRCEYSSLGCQTNLPFKDIQSHRLGCPFTLYTCPKCKKNNLRMGSRLQHKNECELEEISCPECKLNIIRKELEEHSKANCLYNMVSCLFCKMTTNNMTFKDHCHYCKLNWSCKTFGTSQLYKNKCDSNAFFKKIMNIDIQNYYENRMLRKENESLNLTCELTQEQLQKLIFDQSQNIHLEFIKFSEDLVHKFKDSNEAMISHSIEFNESRFNKLEIQNIKIENSLNEILKKLSLQEIDSKAKLVSTDFLIKNSS